MNKRTKFYQTVGGSEYYADVVLSELKDVKPLRDVKLDDAINIGAVERLLKQAYDIMKVINDES